MIRRLLALLLALGLVFGYGTARAGSPVKVQIIDQLLDDDPTSITGARNVGNYEKVGFFVDYDETDSGSVVSIEITVDVSHDGSDDSWIDVSFFGTTETLQTSQTLSSDTNYHLWLNNRIQLPFVRLSIEATGSSATELADVDGYVVGLQ